MTESNSFTALMFFKNSRINMSILIPLLLILSLNGMAQNAKFQINWDNDLFNLLNQTDRYYTNGLNIDFYHPALNHSILNHILFSGNDQCFQTTGIKFYQGIYTPSDISKQEILNLDRPYASVAMVSQEHIAVNPYKKYRVTTSVGLGILGKYGGGALFQNFVHSLTPNSGRANGWENQIKNDLILNYNAKIEKGIFQIPFSQLSVFGETQAGTLQDRASAGSFFSIGLLDPYYGTSFGRSLHKKFTVQVFGKAQLDYIFYDATLEGGVFNNNNVYSIPRENINRSRLEYSFGLQTNIEKVQIEAGRVWQSKEFGGAYTHAWGYLKFVYFIT